jgi:hypothetical protein
LQVIAPPRRKVNVFYGEHGVETLYLGVRGSENQIRVYDKRHELIEKGRATAEHGESTRFEAQVRNANSFEALLRLHDPFSALLLVDLSTDDVSFASALLANHASVFGTHDLKARLDRDEFETLASRWQTAAARNLPHPSAVFAARWPRVVRRLLRQLGVARSTTC